MEHNEKARCIRRIEKGWPEKEPREQDEVELLELHGVQEQGIHLLMRSWVTIKIYKGYKSNMSP